MIAAVDTGKYLNKTRGIN